MRTYKKKYKATYRRIAEVLRAEIMSGKRRVGAQIPSTEKLAEQWDASVATVHTALTSLVKEGWLERLNGTGTYVNDPGLRFVCAGIYHAVDICSNEHPAFVRIIHTALLRQFEEMGKKTQIFIDTRPRDQQAELLPFLDKAIRERTIQCLVAPSLSHSSLPAISRIKIPTAFLNNPLSEHQISSDMDDFFQRSVGRLAEQGCKSIGIISSLIRANTDFYSQFKRALAAAGMATRSQWIRKAGHVLHENEYEPFAYDQFMRLWELKEKPDGLIVYPDVLVRGVITAVLEIGMGVVPPRMKFIFHRNTHLPQMCPFPATWAVSNEDAWARGLIATIEKQFNGEKITPLLLPFELVENPGHSPR